MKKLMLPMFLMLLAASPLAAQSLTDVPFEAEKQIQVSAAAIVSLSGVAEEIDLDVPPIKATSDLADVSESADVIAFSINNQSWASGRGQAKVTTPPFAGHVRWLTVEMIHSSDSYADGINSECTVASFINARGKRVIWHTDPGVFTYTFDFELKMGNPAEGSAMKQTWDVEFGDVASGDRSVLHAEIKPNGVWEIRHRIWTQSYPGLPPTSSWVTEYVDPHPVNDSATRIYTFYASRGQNEKLTLKVDGNKGPHQDRYNTVTIQGPNNELVDHVPSHGDFIYRGWQYW